MLDELRKYVHLYGLLGPNNVTQVYNIILYAELLIKMFIIAKDLQLLIRNLFNDADCFD